jgi:hypothetical protein
VKYLVGRVRAHTDFRSIWNQCARVPDLLDISPDKEKKKEKEEKRREVAVNIQTVPYSILVKPWCPKSVIKSWD